MAQPAARAPLLSAAGVRPYPARGGDPQREVLHLIRICLAAIVATLVLLTATSPAPVAHAGGSDACARHPACALRVAKRQCSQARATRCLDFAALRWHVNGRLLRAIAWCESRLKPTAVNPSPVGPRGEHASGLVQTLPSTFATTPYRRRWILSARYNALAGGWLLHTQGTSPWLASAGCWRT